MIGVSDYGKTEEVIKALELGRACGMRAGVLAITDKGFAKAVKELAEAVTEEKEEHAHDD